MESFTVGTNDSTKPTANEVLQKENAQSGCSSVITKRIKQPNSIRARYQKPQPNISSVKRTASTVSHNESNALRCHENKTVVESSVATIDLTESVAEENPPSKPVERKKNLFPTLTTILNAKKKNEGDTVDKRKKYSKKEKVPPERSKMTIVDLIYFNPNTPTMQTKTQNAPADVPKPIPVPVSSHSQEPPTSVEAEDEENFQTVPKLTISENGEIHIDQNSLFVERNVPDVSATQVVNEDDTTYCSYRKSINTKWGAKETFKFYKALGLFGTDFALMQTVFPKRTRRELKLKFKREERMNRNLINKAMYDVLSFDINTAAENYRELTISESDDIVELHQDNIVSDGRKKQKSSRRKHNKRAVNERPDEECTNLQHTSNVSEDNSRANNNETLYTRRKRKAKLLDDDFVDVDELSLDDDDISYEFIPASDVSDQSVTAVHEASAQSSPRDAANFRGDKTNSELPKVSIQISNEDSVSAYEEEFSNSEVSLTILDSNQNSNESAEINNHSFDSDEVIEISADPHHENRSGQVPDLVMSNKVEINNAFGTSLLSGKSYSVVPLCTDESSPLFSQPYKQDKQMQSALSSENITSKDHNYGVEMCSAPLLSNELEKSAMSRVFSLNSNIHANHKTKSVFVCSEDNNYDKPCQTGVIEKNLDEVDSSLQSSSSRVLSNRFGRKSTQTLLKLTRNNDVSNNSSTLVFSREYEQIKSLQTDFIPHESESNDLALLTDVVADEIVSSNKSDKRKSKKKRTTFESKNSRKSCLSSSKQHNMNFLPSSTVYTPSEELPSCSKHIQFTPKSNLKTYSRKKQLTPDISDFGLSSLQTPCTPDRSFNSQNCGPKKLCSSLNVAKTHSVTIPMTPSPGNNNASPNPLMIFAKAPNEDNILHLFMYNNIDGSNENQNSGDSRKFVQIST